MIRLWLALLVLAFGLVPPGICSCRLEALLFAEAAEEPCSEDPEHDDDCLGIHEDAVVSPGPVLLESSV